MISVPTEQHFTPFTVNAEQLRVQHLVPKHLSMWTGGSRDPTTDPAELYNTTKTHIFCISENVDILCYNISSDFYIGGS